MGETNGLSVLSHPTSLAFFNKRHLGLPFPFFLSPVKKRNQGRKAQIRDFLGGGVLGWGGVGHRRGFIPIIPTLFFFEGFIFFFLML